MKLKNTPEYRHAIDSASAAIRLINKSGKPALAAQLQATLEAVEQSRFIIGVIGATKRGKSTLVNGLLGRSNDDLAPIAMMPATNTISIFSHSEHQRISVWFSDRPDEPEIITESEIRLYATEKHNPGNRKQVRSIEIQTPLSGLEPGTLLVDTPGAGNALEEMHTGILLNFLPNADAVIFLVTGEKPITASEKALLSAVRKRDVGKLFFAVNMADRIESGDMTPDEFAEGIQHNRDILKSIGFTPKIYRISAKSYYSTRRDPGTEEMLRDIQKTIAEEKVQIQLKRLLDQTHSALSACRQELSNEYEESIINKEQLRAELEGLKIAHRELELSRTAREHQFYKTWQDAFAKLEESVLLLRKQIKEEYRELIEKTPNLQISALSTTIHADLLTRFGELLEPAIGECEQSIAAAQKELISDVRATTLRVAPALERIATPMSQAKGAMDIALAGLPTLATGAVAAILPSAIGTAVGGIASGTMLAIPAGLAGATLAGMLSLVAFPSAIIAFGLGSIKIISAWKQHQFESKNTLLRSVIEQIEEVVEQSLAQIKVYREKKVDVLANFNGALAVEIASTQDRLQELLHKQKSEQEIESIKSRMDQFLAEEGAILSFDKKEVNSERLAQKSLMHSIV